jgi:hypothetical protein
MADEPVWKIVGNEIFRYGSKVDNELIFQYLMQQETEIEKLKKLCDGEEDDLDLENTTDWDIRKYLETKCINLVCGSGGDNPKASARLLKIIEFIEYL